MFEGYSERAKRAIFFARYEAQRYGSPTIEPEHLLLGTVREGGGNALGYFRARDAMTASALRQEIEDRIVIRDRIPQSSSLELSENSQKALFIARQECKLIGAAYVLPEHILVGLVRHRDTVAGEILRHYGVDAETVRSGLMPTAPTRRDRRTREQSERSFVEDYTRDLTAAAAAGKLDPLIGREAELARVTEILSRRTKNNPVLVGEAGGGKTAIVEGLAQRISDGDVPGFLEGKKLVMLDLSAMVAGTKYRGQFEERLNRVLAEIRDNGEYIVFIDEIHTLVGAGSAEGALDAANILKPALSRSEIKVIGATTPAEFRKSIERDKALERRFQAVSVLPPSEPEALEIVRGLADRFEAFHQVRYSDDALRAAVYSSNRYIPNRSLPDKAIDLMDEAGAHAKLRRQAASRGDRSWTRTVKNWKRTAATDEERLTLELEDLSEEQPPVEVTKDDIHDVIARWTGVPVASIGQDEAAKLLGIEERLHRRVVAQRSAINALARAIRRSRAGLKNPSRPVGSFLFLGPTGVGKTEVARALAEYLFGSEKSLIRFDMSEYNERHTVSKLIGSPPGYVGHEEGGQLTERLRRSPYSVVLFDEIEKAHSDLNNILLQIFEDGSLTDGQGTAVDCRNAIFILTSNLGAKHIRKQSSPGFHSGDSSRAALEVKVMSEVRNTFPPELINRLDEIIIFDELSRDDLEAIIELQFDALNLLLAERGMSVSADDAARSWLIDSTVSEKGYGARPLKRALRRYVEDELSEALIRGDFDDGTSLQLTVIDGKLAFSPAETLV